MGRLEGDQCQLFYSFRLDEAVPADHRAREIAAVLDLSWVHAREFIRDGLHKWGPSTACDGPSQC